MRHRPSNYAKAGVVLLDLQAGDVEQGELDLDDAGADRSRLMGPSMRSTAGMAAARTRRRV
jgi:hypothetical protein